MAEAVNRIKDEARFVAGERTGGQLLVDALRTEGLDRIFCVPGESYLEVLDALHDVPEIQLVVCRHEGAAANMAEADGKLTARPGVAFVTRGPGALHASVGVHTAFHDSTPMILFVGQVQREIRGREAFQEIDVAAVFAPITKWAAEIDRADRIPEFIHRAYSIATAGRCGPVVLSVPEDVLTDVAAGSGLHRTPLLQQAPSSEDVARVRAALAAAERPVLIVGGSGWSDAALADLQRFAVDNALPVVASSRRQDLFDNRHPNYAGHLSLATSRALAARVERADLIIALGARLSDVTTRGYTLVRAPRAAQRIAHIYPDPNEIGRVYEADVGLVASHAAAAAALAGMPRIDPARWRPWLADMRLEYEQSTDPASVSMAGPVDLAAIVAHVDKLLPPDGIVTNGAGNYTIWLHRFFRYRTGHTQLAPTSGAMGYGLPAAVAAKLRHPRRPVVCFAGDGCFLMYPQELATAIQHQAPIIVVVVNNSIYGTIRMHQERRYPGRVSGTDMVNPDLVALAQSFGAHAEAVTTTAEFAPAFERALSSDRLSLIDVHIDPSQLTPDFRLPAAGAAR
ncbi:MAG TPA: thiamine pyrophosphate-binding protein [Bauldia sp.]|nr:thiamine pyrophosphate-binding protein [Bauldia sp.]